MASGGGGGGKDGLFPASSWGTDGPGVSPSDSATPLNLTVRRSRVLGRLYCGKTADSIEMPFGVVGRVGPRNHVLDGWGPVAVVEGGGTTGV